MQEREALQIGLEFLGKLFAIQEGHRGFARAAYAPVSQTNGLFDKELERVPAAFTSLEGGDRDAIRNLLKSVTGREGRERSYSRFVPTFHAHHENPLSGLAVLTSDMRMSDSNDTFKILNDLGINTGTNKEDLISGSSTLFHPAAHTDPDTLSTGSYKASEAILSKHRQASPEDRAKAAYNDLIWARDTSRQAFNLPGEREIRMTLSNLTGIPIEDMMSTDLDTTLRDGSKRSFAASNALRMANAGQIPIVRGIVQEALRQYGGELYIPKIEKHPWPTDSTRFGKWKKMSRPKESDYINEYLRTERPGLAEAIEMIKGIQDNKRNRKYFRANKTADTSSSKKHLSESIGTETSGIQSGTRLESPGDSKERALVINSEGGDVNIGDGVLRSNGKNGHNGKH